MFEILRLWWMPYLLGSAFFAIFAYLVWLVRRSRRAAEAVQAPADNETAVAREAEPDEVAEPEIEEGITPAESRKRLRRSFQEGMAALRRHAGRQGRYRVPFFLMLGPMGSRPAELLEEAGMGLPFGAPDPLPADGSGCAWWLFDRGVMLEVGGSYVLGEEGRATDDAGWKALIDLLIKHRPERPLDGVVLTLDCSQLLAAQRRGSEGLNQLERRIGQIYRKLSQAQRQLGLRFPVYILCTGAETLTGFDSFCAALPRRLHAEVFGWSNPYGVDTVFRQSWLEEAFRMLDHRLHQAQLEIYAERPEAVDSDDLFQFPQAVQGLRTAIAKVMERLSQANAYAESLVLRGLYFCGRAGDSPGAEGSEHSEALGAFGPEASWASEDPGQVAVYGGSEDAMRAGMGAPAAVAFADKPRSEGASRGSRFLRQLLERKIFREVALANPTPGALALRNRKLTLARVALVLLVAILGLGTWRAQARLDRQKDALQPFLNQTLESLRELRSVGTVRSQRDSLTLRDQATDLLAGLRGIENRRFSSFFLPASWVGPVNENLGQAMEKAFSEIMFQAMEQMLHQKAEQLIEAASPASYRLSARPYEPLMEEDTQVPQAAPIDQLAEFQALSEYLDELALLQLHYELFNRLGDSASIDDLAAVVLYLFDTTLPEHLRRSSGIFRQTLAGARYDPFAPDRYKSRARENVRQLADRFYRRLFDQSVLRQHLDLVSSELRNLEQPGRDVIEKARRLRTLVESVSAFERALAKPDLEWAFRSNFQLGAAYAEMLDAVSRSAFLGEEQSAELARRGESRWIVFRRDLEQHLGSDLTGHLLRIGADGLPEMYLSDGLQLLQGALRRVLREPFMMTEAGRPMVTRIPPSKRQTWDLQMLGEAIGQYDNYQRFVDKRLNDFRERIRPLLARLARESASATILDLVAQAQDFDEVSAEASARLREESISARVNDFETVANPLGELLELFLKLQATDAHAQLSNVLAEQTDQLLTDVNDLLEEERLYASRREVAWSGNNAVSLAAFGLRDQEELARFLDLERQRLAQLAQDFANPLVTWMDSSLDLPAALRPLHDKWKTIVTELHDYEKRKPGNSVEVLEQEIVGQAKLDLLQCVQMPESRRELRETGDFFLERRNQLHTELRRRCLQFAETDAKASYALIAERFNRHLAGKYPFSQLPQGVFAQEAGAEELESFLRLWDQRSIFLDYLPEGTPQRQPIADFVRRMRSVRGFFAHFVEREEPDPMPIFELGVDFRVRRDEEVGAEQIIGWQLEVDNKPVSFRDAERSVLWRPGLPLRLRMRWARHGAVAPVPTSGRPSLAEDGHTLLYEYNNRWSLFAFIAEHRLAATEQGQLVEERPHTLRLRLETQPNGDGRGRELEPSEALLADRLRTSQVFLRVALRAPKSKDPLVLPVFPSEAPELELPASEIEALQTLPATSRPASRRAPAGRGPASGPSSSGPEATESGAGASEVGANAGSGS